MSCKQLVWLYGDHYIQISGWTAVGPWFSLPSDGNDALIVHTGRDVYGYLYVLSYTACSFTFRTRLINYLAASPALVAGGHALELTERRPLCLRDLAGTSAFRTMSSWMFPVLSLPRYM